MRKCDVGIISDDRLGVSLARTMEQQGYLVSLYQVNLSARPAKALQSDFADELEGSSVEVLFDMETFLLTLPEQRIVFLLSKGEAFYQKLLPELQATLSPNDIIVDCGEVDHETSTRRCRLFHKESGIYYLGTGFLCGEDGVLFRPSFLIGGPYVAYDRVRLLLGDIAAQVDGFVCCPYVGPEGAGDYVKMIHDSIEQVQLQLLSEAVLLLHKLLGFDVHKIHDVLSDWNEHELDSFLLDSAADLVSRFDKDTNKPLMQIVLDKLDPSPSSQWICQNAMALSVPIPSMVENLQSEFLSNYKNERIVSSKMIKNPKEQIFTDLERKALVERIRRALYMGSLCAFVQGFALLAKASDQYAWNVDFLSVARTFQGGGHLRSKLLERVMDAFSRSKLDNLFLDASFRSAAEAYVPDLREVIAFAVRAGISVPSLCSTISYIDQYRCPKSMAGFVQLMRDYISADGYERMDRPGVFYADWKNPAKSIRSWEAGLY